MEDTRTRVDAGQLATRKQLLTSTTTITSRFSSKAQTTIPQPVRSALHLRAGDEIAYVIEAEAWC